MNKDLYQELADYLNKDKYLVRERCQYAPAELAWRWYNREDKSDFYKDEDLYIFDLTMYQNFMHSNGWYEWYDMKLKELKPNRMLDFGGGIGEYSVIAKQNGVASVTYLDILGSHTANYAIHRFGKYKVDVNLHDIILDYTLPEKYDLIVCMDVLEHLEEPRKWLKEMSEKTTYLIMNENVPYNIFYPQHISQPIVSEYFNKVDRDLWRSKLSPI